MDDQHWPTCDCEERLNAFTGLVSLVNGCYEPCHDCGTMWLVKNGVWQRALAGVDFGVDRGTVEVVHDVEFGTVVVVHGESDG